MAVEAVARYQQMRGRGTCNKCGAAIVPGELYFIHLYTGLLLRTFCEQCPPSGAEHAREHHRKASMQAGARQARRAKRQADNTGTDGIPRQDVPAAGREASADRVQEAGGSAREEAVLHPLIADITRLFCGGPR